MASIKRAALILLLISAIIAKPTVVEIHATTSYSPPVKSYYTQLMKDLRFYFSDGDEYYLDKESESATGENIASTTNLGLNISPRQYSIGTWHLSPLLHFSFSHKRLKFQQSYIGLFESTYFYSYQRLTNIYAGLSPEFSYCGKQIVGSRFTPFVALRPQTRVVQRFHYGQLDEIAFTTGQIGVEAQVGLLRSVKQTTRYRGLALSVSALYERAVAGDRHMKTTYAYVLDRENHYPKHSWHVGMALAYTVRSFKKGEAN